MNRKRPTIFTTFFIFAIELLACSFAVSTLVWICEGVHVKLADTPLLPIWTFLFPLIVFATSIYFYSKKASKWIVYPKNCASFMLLGYWFFVIIFFIPVVDFFVWQSSNNEIHPWIMVTLSVLLLIIYIFSEKYLLKYSMHWPSMRIILFRRFVILGDIIIWLERGWHAVAVKFIDIIFATWLVQSLSRILLKTTLSDSLSNFSFYESIILPANPSNGSIFNSFSMTYQNVSHPIYYSGHNFASNIVSSVFSLLWHYGTEVVAVWFILEVFGYLLSSSDKLVIINASDGYKSQSTKDEKDDSSKSNPTGPNLADLLATKLDRIKQIYQTVDEKRSIQSACGVGEPIDAAIKVERLEDISLSSTSEIKLGPFGIPASSVSALISHILMGPKITIGLYSREKGSDEDDEEREKGYDTEKMKAKHVLVANMSGKMGSQRWVVECRESLEGESRGEERSIEDMVTEMAHRIHASYAGLQSKNPGQSISWRALWNFNEGLRAYRDSLLTNKKHKFYLNRAEKKFIDALKEENSFSLAHYNLGVVYAELDQPDSAQECFQKAIDVNPDSWEACYALGIVIFRRAKEIEQTHEILGMNMQPQEEKRIADDYEKVILLCNRVLDIKSREDKILEKDFSAKAKAYDLMGNAQVRLASISQINNNNKDNKAKKLSQAETYLEKAVNYSWMALIKESILHETAEDETSVVSECSLDLAYVYLELSKNPGSDRWPNMRAILMQAIYVDPKDVRLYYLLALAGEIGYPNTKWIYEQIQLINPNCNRIKANLASIELASERKPDSWMKECEKLACCKDEEYQRVYHFLVQAINEEENFLKKDYLSREHSYKMEKKIAHLIILNRQEKKDILKHQMKKLGFWLKEYCDPCPVLVHLDRDCAKDLIYNSSFDVALSELQNRLGPLSVSKTEKANAFEIMDDLLALGICRLKFALLNIDDLITDDEYDGRDERITDITDNLRISKDCFHAVLKISREFEIKKDLKLPWKFYKLQCAHYMVDTGVIMLKIRANKKPNDNNNRELIEWTEELLIKAKEVFNEVDPEEIKLNKINLRLAQTYLALGKLTKALKEAQIAKNLNPLEYEERKVLGEIYCKLEEYKHGLSELNVALSYKPDDSEILFCTGRAYFSAGKDCKRKGEERNWILKNARDKLEEALDIADRSDIMYRGKIRYWIGKTLLETGKYEEAIPHLRILAGKNEKDFLPALYLGYAFLKCNFHEECERCLYKLIRSLRSKKKDDKAIICEFYGQEYYENRHINEILARAYIYLAYSYAKRDANLCGSWRLTYESQFFVDNLREDLVKEEERARGGVLPMDGLIWEEVPGTHSKKLREFLIKIFGLDWAIDADIEKIDNDKAIQVSYEDNSLFLVLYSNECKAFLIIDDGRICEIRAIRENKNHKICLPDMPDISCMNLRMNHSLSDGYAIDGMNDFKIRIIFNPRDGLRKRKSKAHLAECAGTICYKMGNLDFAIEYLNASIALYPDAGAYLNLAKTYERLCT